MLYCIVLPARRTVSYVCVFSSELDMRMKNGRAKAGYKMVYFIQMLMPGSYR